MIRSILAFIAVFLLPATALCAQPIPPQPKSACARPLTLFDCYRLSVKQSEIIAVDAERITEAQGRFLQSLGTALPQVAFVRTDTWTDLESSNKKYEQKFVFTQPLFTGFREFAQIAAAKLETKQAAREKARAEQLLFVDVADAFYLLLETRNDLAALDTIRQAISDRLDELKTRENLGKSRASEVVSTQTQMYTLDDQVESVKAQELVARELLAFLIGRPVQEIADTRFNYSLKDESEYAANAGSRPDVLAQELAWMAARKNITVAQSGFFPSVSVEGDYYTRDDGVPGNRWDALLKINFPLFEGTSTIGRVKEARARAKEGELLFTRQGRIAGREIHNAYVNANAAFSRIKILEKALRSAELNYELQAKDYQMNVVNNLDVLSAIQQLEDVRRTYNHILHQGKRYYWQLRVAAGDLDPDNP